MLFRSRSLSAVTVLVPRSSRVHVRVPLCVSLPLSISFHAGLGLPKRPSLNGENPSFLFFFSISCESDRREGGREPLRGKDSKDAHMRKMQVCMEGREDTILKVCIG